MSSERSKIENVRLRNDFYKLSFRRIIWVLLISFIVNIGLGVYIFILRGQNNQPFYVTAVTSNGQMIPLHPALIREEGSN
jgi:hypothetical protein